MELAQVVNDVVTGLIVLDGRGVRFKQFQPGVGPYGRGLWGSALDRGCKGATPDCVIQCINS
jgi:hypothetical protein